MDLLTCKTFLDVFFSNRIPVFSVGAPGGTASPGEAFLFRFLIYIHRGQKAKAKAASQPPVAIPQGGFIAASSRAAEAATPKRSSASSLGPEFPRPKIVGPKPKGTVGAALRESLAARRRRDGPTAHCYSFSVLELDLF